MNLTYEESSSYTIKMLRKDRTAAERKMILRIPPQAENTRLRVFLLETSRNTVKLKISIKVNMRYNLYYKKEWEIEKVENY